ncbi:MAG: hypothetical protein MZU95_16960 [Desulfomicrobium escambiense]|nr:hypothetical protein [Desulfomicrobium escambiense]
MPASSCSPPRAGTGACPYGAQPSSSPGNLCRITGRDARVVEFRIADHHATVHAVTWRQGQGRRNSGRAQGGLVEKAGPAGTETE